MRFGVFEADLRTFELRKFGNKINIQRQPFQVLAALLEKPGEVVTRQELQQKIWPGDTFVDFDLGLNKAITKLRAILDDDAANPRFIETVPRVGYRFLGAVVTAPRETAPEKNPAVPQEKSFPATSEAVSPIPSAENLPPSPHSRRRWPIYVGSLLALIVAGSVLYPVLHEKWIESHGGTGRQFNSIAVLPLENLSGDASQDYFADGITEELTTDLAKIPDLRVSSRTSVMRFKNAHQALPEIAKELKVEAIVEGSVTRIGNKVRITAQLIDAGKDQHLWAESYDSEIRDILSVQNNLARAIAHEIRVNLTPEQEQRMIPVSHVPPADAYEAYLKGRHYFLQWTDEGVQKSCNSFQQAIQSDGAYAEAYVGMADCYTARASNGLLKPDEAMAKAKEYAQKALELNPALPQAHGVLGTILLNYDWNYPAAYIELQKMAELSPNNPEAHLRLVSYYHAVGEMDKAAEEAKLAQKLDPVTSFVCSSLGMTYLFAAKYDDSIAEFNKCIDLDQNFPWSHWGLVHDYEAKKDYWDAIEERRKLLLAGHEENLAEEMMQIYKRSGYAAARAYAVQHDLDPKHNSSFTVAYANVELGNKSKALEYLQKAYDERDSQMIQLKVNSLFDGLRSEPQFQQLLQKIGS